MRSYGQYCGLAKALDVVGDRWTLLIVRELFLLGAARYTDLQHGLPGIATNMLASRLRDMEEAGLVAREDAPPPAVAALFRLTPRGEALEPVLAALGIWAAPLLGEWNESLEIRSYWLALPVKLYLRDAKPDGPPVSIEVRIGEDEPMTLDIARGVVRARRGAARRPDAVISGVPHLVMRVLMGVVPLSVAVAQGLTFTGKSSVLRRLARAA